MYFMYMGYVGNDDCEVPYCHFCGLSLPINFKLIGLCKGSIIDSQYFLNIDGTGKELEFSGYGQTDIKKNEESGEWEIVDVLDSSIVRAKADMKTSSSREYPFGVVSWKTLNDSCGGEIADYKLSGCSKVNISHSFHL